MQSYKSSMLNHKECLSKSASLDAKLEDISMSLIKGRNMFVPRGLGNEN